MIKLENVVLAAFIAFITGCGLQQGKIDAKSVGDSQEEDSLEHYVEIGTISDVDQWLNVDYSAMKSNNERRLADAYNASVVLNSLITDFDLQMRFGEENEDVAKAIKAIDVTKVKDAEVLAKLKDYKDEMLFLLSSNPDSVDQSIHNPWIAEEDLFDFLSQKYHVSTFGSIDENKYQKEYYSCPSVPEWDELREQRGDSCMVNGLMQKYNNARDFDARCIYAIELGHAYEADLDAWETDDYENPAIHIMESLMKERKYSLYLNELWQKWRVLYQSSKGASKDSEIPNQLYNNYRNMCCSTILSFIGEHPYDIKAINQFLLMACKENILRYGQFEYGNQYAVEKYYLFPERYVGRSE